MQNRNLILFLTLSMATLIAWNTFVVPRIFPHKPAAAQNAAQKDADAAKAVSPAGEKKKAESEKTAGEPKKSDAHAAVSAKKGDDKAVAVARDAKAQGNAKAGKVPTYGRKTIVLGSSDPDTGYFLQLEATSRGAAIAGIEFNDPRYRELTHPKIPLETRR